MKSIKLVALLIIMGMALTSQAKGYRIHLKMPDIKDSVVFLAHYYGKSLPTIYKRDSVRLDKMGTGEFKSDDPAFVGGIYMMLLSDMKTYFEFLLNSGDDITITAPVSKVPDGVKFKNSPENERFQAYVTFLKSYQAGQNALTKEYAEAKTATDSANIRKKAELTSHDLTNYRRDYVAKNPNTLLSAIFKALEVPEVPKGDHFLADGKTKDTTFTYRYYKAHFWDGFDFKDDRLIYTPIYDAKLEEYINKLTLPWPDSVKAESDFLVKKARGSKDVFKYTLFWLAHTLETSKIMGMDEAFVHLIENYYMKGDAFWLTSEELSKYIDRAQKIAPNVLGNVSPEVKVPNLYTKKLESMHSIKAKYTLLVFYSPNCGHCQHEMPSLDSLYEAVLKPKGVKVMTVATEGDEKAIKEFIKKYNFEDWTNCWDDEHIGDWRGKFDVYSTPTIYLMDEKKIIRGKRLDHTNIASMINILENKAKEKEKAKENK